MTDKREEELRRIRKWMEERRRRMAENQSSPENTQGLADDTAQGSMGEKAESASGSQMPAGYKDWPLPIRKRWREEWELQKKFASDDKQGIQIRRYLEWFEKVPWKREEPRNTSLLHAKRILDDEHYGMEDVKQIILEVLAVQKLKAVHTGSTLLLSGPPGVGKTSLAKSIAHALDRPFQKIALGGMTDELALKGSDRAYMNSFPGGIIRALCQCSSSSPVILLDEIDKVPSDTAKGDCIGILLDILDSNRASFMDNFLHVPVDLSQVFFVCTANDEDRIPKPLMDRMEAIRLRGYTQEEKMKIVRKHIIPKKLDESGLSSFNYMFSDDAVERLVEACTEHKGVRELERLVAAVCRRVALLHLSSHMDSTEITRGFIEQQGILIPRDTQVGKRIGFYLEGL